METNEPERIEVTEHETQLIKLHEIHDLFSGHILSIDHPDCKFCFAKRKARE